MASSRDALKAAGAGPCRQCGKFRLVFGKRLRLCRDCANELDYWVVGGEQIDTVNRMFELFGNEESFTIVQRMTFTKKQ